MEDIKGVVSPLQERMIPWWCQQELFIPQFLCAGPKQSTWHILFHLILTTPEEGRDYALGWQKRLGRLREVRHLASSHTASEERSQAHGGLSPAAQPESLTPVLWREPVTAGFLTVQNMSSPLIIDFITRETAGLGGKKIA